MEPQWIPEHAILKAAPGFPDRVFVAMRRPRYKGIVW
jgi:hypothetical protein